MADICQTPNRFAKKSLCAMRFDGANWCDKVFAANFDIRKKYFMERNTQLYTMNACNVIMKYPSLACHIVRVFEEGDCTAEEANNPEQEYKIASNQRVVLKISGNEILALSSERLFRLYSLLVEIITCFATINDAQLKQGLNLLLLLVKGETHKVSKKDAAICSGTLMKIVGQYQTVASCAAIRMTNYSDINLMDACYVLLVALPRIFYAAGRTEDGIEMSVSKKPHHVVSLFSPPKLPKLRFTVGNLYYPLTMRAWPCVGKQPMKNESIIFAAAKDLKFARRTVLVKALVITSAGIIRACARHLEHCEPLEEMAQTLLDALECKKSFVKAEKVHQIFQSMKNMQSNYIHLVVHNARMYGCVGELSLFTVFNHLVPMFQFCSFRGHDLVFYANCSH